MFSDGGSLSVSAAAKINLFLEVLGRRENGYHDIRSIVVPIDLCDTVTLEPTDGEIETRVRIDVRASGATAKEGGLNGSIGWTDAGLSSPSNIATKAAEALRAETGYGGGVRIRIVKRIPVGGGLGGGSADAAAVLRGAARLWGVEISDEGLARIGAGLGCDVPALLHGGAVCMEGLGETVSRLGVHTDSSVREWWVVLLNPGFRVSTRDIYSRCSASLTSDDGRFKSMVSALKTGDVALAGRSLHNGLGETVCRKYPLIRMLKDELAAGGALGAMVSGSGASVFGLAGDREHAKRLAGSITGRLGYPVWSLVTRTLPDGVMAAHGPLEARV